MRCFQDPWYPTPIPNTTELHPTWHECPDALGYAAPKISFHTLNVGRGFRSANHRKKLHINHKTSTLSCRGVKVISTSHRSFLVFASRVFPCCRQKFHHVLAMLGFVALPPLLWALTELLLGGIGLSWFRAISTDLDVEPEAGVLWIQTFPSLCIWVGQKRKPQIVYWCTLQHVIYIFCFSKQSVWWLAWKSTRWGELWKQRGASPFFDIPTKHTYNQCRCIPMIGFQAGLQCTSLPAFVICETLVNQRYD